jgi:methylmalonyl-CoA/ethylmalonyl-CoA epimerase
MAKIRHIALATKDPRKTADFYINAFGFKEVAYAGPPNPKPGQVYGYYISDGTLNLAILNFGDQDQIGRGTDYVGLHHFGVLIDGDLEGMVEKLEGMGADCFMGRPGEETGAFYETKFHGPDGVVFDIAIHPWVGSEPEHPVKAAAE